MRDVHHVHQQISLTHLIKGTLKALYQIGGQLADKAHRICQQERQIVDGHLPHSGIKGGEELILCKHFALGQQVHHRTLSHIGIAHQGHTNQATSVFTLGGLLFVDLCQTLFQQGDALQDDTTVHLQLSLTRATKPHGTFSATRARSATLSFQVCPKPLQTGEHIAMLRQFHLSLRLSGLRPHSEDIQYQRSTVEDLYLQFLLDVSHLLGAELIVEDDHTHRLWGVGLIQQALSPKRCILSIYPVIVGVLALLDVRLDLQQFSTTHISGLTGTAYFLGKPLHSDSTSRIGQELQFVEIFFSLGFVLIFGDESYQHRSFSLRL